MSILSKIKKIILDIVEVYIPVLMLLLLFASFIIGIFCRYVLKNPQSWTYEMSSISFLTFVILSACYVQRTEQHIVFDMIFNKMSSKVQCVMRCLSNIIVCITNAFLIPASIKYIGSMKGLTSQVMKIPRGMIFVCFVVLFITTCIRAAYRAVLDIKSFKSGTYLVLYFEDSKEAEK